MHQQPVSCTTTILRPAVAFPSILCLVALVGCGGDSSSLQTPTPVVTTRAITVTVPAGLAVGDSLQATASSTMSDGTTRAVTTGFRSDVPAVATVTDSGTVTGVAAGRANIYVVSDGQQGTANIQVAPNYGGSWSGSYYVTSCSQTGDFAAANVCAPFSPNRVLPYDMGLSQKGGAVSGDFYLGSIPFSQVSALVGGAGELVLPGTYGEDTFTIVCTWDLTSPTAGRLNGSVRQVWRDSDASGEMIVTGTVRDSMRLATGAKSDDGAVSEAVQRWRRRTRR
jgi:hypothetical protein